MTENSSWPPTEPDAGENSAPLPTLPRPEILGQPVSYVPFIPVFAVNSTLSYKRSKQGGSKKSGRASTGRSSLETKAYEAIVQAGIPTDGLQQEFRFCADLVGPGAGLRARLAKKGLRDFRFDFAWPREKVAVEIEGGTWAGGRHTRGVGFDDDCTKYNVAQNMGWAVYRFTGKHIRTGELVSTLREAFGLT